MSDALNDSRRFRALCVVDDFTSEALAVVVDVSLSAIWVACELNHLIEQRGKPKMIVSDNGTELTSHAIFRWAQDQRIEWHYIAPGKPQQNGKHERMHRTLKAETLRPPAAMATIRLRSAPRPKASRSLS